MHAFLYPGSLYTTRNAARCSLREHFILYYIPGNPPQKLFSSSPPTFISKTLAKSHSLGHPGDMPYSWLSEALDLTQMVMDIRKPLKITIFIIPSNCCINNITKKSFPGTSRRGHALLLGVGGSVPRPDGHGLFAAILA